MESMSLKVLLLRQSIATVVSVCLSVCLLAYLINDMFKLQDIFCTCYQTTSSRDLVVLWRQCNALCTSGFVDDVMFSHNGANTDTGHR